MGVPLKFDELVDVAVQGGGGGVVQFMLSGEKTILISLCPTKVAEPERV